MVGVCQRQKERFFSAKITMVVVTHLQCCLNCTRSVVNIENLFQCFRCQIDNRRLMRKACKQYMFQRVKLHFYPRIDTFIGMPKKVDPP